MATWLIIDANYLCYRAYYSLGELKHGSIATGTVFGFMQAVVALQDSFNTQNVVFCFDSRQSLRAQSYPQYKATRKAEEATWDDEERESKREFREQVTGLRRTYLPAIGYANVFHARGYESDDIIAEVRNRLPPNDEKIIISADKDLFQLLHWDTIMHNPQTLKTYTNITFVKEWGLQPDQWVDVKALAGCGTDDIAGIKGVGEVTAAKYLRGELAPHTATYRKIAGRAGQAIWRRNIPLVQLPYAGCPQFVIGTDAVTEAKWEAFADGMGFRSIRGHAPIPTRVARRRYGEQERKGFDI